MGNKQVFTDSEFIIMVVGGPNARRDFHVDPGEEFFYQLEGGITLATVQEGKRVDVPSAKAKYSCCRLTCRTRRAGRRTRSAS